MNTIVNNIPIVGNFAIIRNGKIICSCSDEYSPEIAVMEVLSIYATGDELIIEVY